MPAGFGYATAESVLSKGLPLRTSSWRACFRHMSLGDEIQKCSRAPRQAALPQIDGMDVEPGPAHLGQDMFEPAGIEIGLHHVIGAERDAFAVDRQIARKPGAADKVGTGDADPMNLLPLCQRPRSVAAQVGIADTEVAAEVAESFGTADTVEMAR